MKTAKTSRYNFSAGPTVLPETVLQRIKTEALEDWMGLGVSVFEVSHRHPVFLDVANTMTERLRLLLNVPQEYRILWLPAGARVQFAMLSMNLAKQGQKASYLISGHWSSAAALEAKRYVDVECHGAELNTHPYAFPTMDLGRINAHSAYCHYASNETITGLQCHHAIELACDVPIVADMSSDILSVEFDLTHYGMVYAALQKNIGIPGLTLVIIKEDLLDRAQAQTPSIFHYKTQVDASSLFSTASTFDWQVAAYMLEWVQANGGVEAMSLQAKAKSSLLYQCIDHSALYVNHVAEKDRSCMNVSFDLNVSGLTQTFLSEAEKEGFIGLKGHALLGGCRASLYNAVSIESVRALVDFMKWFELQHG